MSPLRPKTASRETDTGHKEEIRDKDGDTNRIAEKNDAQFGREIIS